MITRLAPTPSGFLHWGNLLNFALTHATARAAGGTLWLRIDDVDASRMRPEYVQDVFDTLGWLGLDWDLGPRDAGDFARKYSQQLRREEYRDRLRAIDTYACECTRQQILARAGSTRYDGHCRSRGLRHVPGVTALRARIGDQIDEHADPVLWTREDRPAYHWVSVLDDLRMGTTDLIRGEDLRESSAIQQRLAQEMGESAYASIRHRFHPLLMGPDGKKLSKSADAESLRSRRLAGARPDDVWVELRRIAGYDPRTEWPPSNSG